LRRLRRQAPSSSGKIGAAVGCVLALTVARLALVWLIRVSNDMKRRIMRPAKVTYDVCSPSELDLGIDRVILVGFPVDQDASNDRPLSPRLDRYAPDLRVF
jgi:hypothetical protein